MRKLFSHLINFRKNVRARGLAKSSFTIGLLMLFMLSLAPGAFAEIVYQTISNTDFESGTFGGVYSTYGDGWLVEANPGGLSIVSAPGGATGKVMKATINKTEDYSKVCNATPRAEIESKKIFTVGSDYQISWKTYLPADYQFDNAINRELFMQIHHDSLTGSPNFELGLQGTQYYYDSAFFDTPRSFLDASNDRGKWVSWKLRYKPSGSATTAATQLYKNGQLVLNYTGQNAYSSGLSFMKVGVYKWDWNVAAYASKVTNRTVYFDDVNIAKASGTDSTTPTTPAVPAAPTNLAVKSISGGTTAGSNYYVNLTWTDNATNETGYQIYQATNATGPFTIVKSPAINTQGYGVNVGSTPGTYYFKVAAVNSAGKSEFSNTVEAKAGTTSTIPTIPAVPAAPTNLNLTSITKGTTSGNYYVNLTWKDNATNETGYQILESTSASGPFTVIKTPAVNAQGYSVNIGTKTGTFYYQVKAVNAAGTSAPSNTIEAKVGTTASIPAAPTNLVLKSVTRGTTSGNYYINLVWKDNATNETGYQILESVNSTSNFRIIKTPAANAQGYSVNIGSYPVKGTHYYKVKAVNAAGVSKPSNTVYTRIR